MQFLSALFSFFARFFSNKRGIAFRKELLQLAVLSFGMALYNLFVEPLWAGYVTGADVPLGVGETALGYFLWLSMLYVFSRFLTRGMGETN